MPLWVLTAFAGIALLVELFYAGRFDLAAAHIPVAAMITLYLIFRRG